MLKIYVRRIIIKHGNTIPVRRMVFVRARGVGWVDR